MNFDNQSPGDRLYWDSLKRKERIQQMREKSYKDNTFTPRINKVSQQLPMKGP